MRVRAPAAWIDRVPVVNACNDQLNCIMCPCASVSSCLLICVCHLPAHSGFPLEAACS